MQAGQLRIVSRHLLAEPAPEVAPQLLHKLIRVGPCLGRIVEVEAYTSEDPASHSFRGATPRNRSMFGAPGTLYVYLIYGMHLCANVVTGAAGDGQAVLIRAVLPLSGISQMRTRRPGWPDAMLANGPGKLCMALGVQRSYDGTDLCDRSSPVQLLGDDMEPPQAPTVGPRIGISSAREVPWRWRVP
jgi:DNA-3-methyladenine glycosylase